MTDKKVEPARQQEIRVIDRRSFTSDGAPRSPDADSSEEPSSPVAAQPAESAQAEAPSARTSGRGDAVASAPFQSLVVYLARQAAAHLGADAGPLGGQSEIDLEAAQQMIDILDSLRLKTRGNLTRDEQEMIEGLIGDLQMQFVTARSKDPKTS